MRKLFGMTIVLLLVLSTTIACAEDESTTEAPDETAIENGSEVDIEEAEAEPETSEVDVEEDEAVAGAEGEDEEADEEIEIVGAASDIYQHPSGAFSMKTFGALQEELENGAVFSDDTASVIVNFAEAESELNEESVQSLADGLLATWVNSGEIDDYVLYTDEIIDFANGYIVYFEFSSATLGDGAGEIFATQGDETLYMAMLITQDYAAVEDNWNEVLESFTIGSATGVVEATAEEEEEVGEAPAENSQTEAGTYTYDSGFRPEINGFSFENYINEANITNLTSAEIRRMFGDQVCASLNGNECILTPPARQWMKQINEYMAGGHCEGMAVLSLLLYYGQTDPGDFGGSMAYDLPIDNEALQREIAYWWTTQTVFPAALNKIQGPTTVLDTLIEAFQAGPAADESWSIGIYMEDGSGGHAITPFAVEDMGDGLFHVLVYDNNYPGETRILEINRNEDTFSYEAAINPEEEFFLYTGVNIDLTATSGRLQQQECDFCAGNGIAQGKVVSGLAAAAPQGYIQVWLDDEADLLITDAEGRRIGWISDDEFVNEIPGAKTQTFTYGADVWDVDYEPLYFLPTDLDFFTITVDGSWLEEAASAEVSMIGPGYDLIVEDLWLDPGESDEIDVAIVGDQQYELTYRTQYNDSPDVVVGLETDEADYEFVVRGADIESGGEFHVELDFTAGDFILNTTGNEEYGTYELLVVRIDDDGESVFGHDDILMEPNDTMYVNFLEWEGEGSSLYLDFDYGDDGTLDETVELEDESDFYDDVYEDWEDDSVEE